MKKYTHAWLAMMAMKRIEKAKIPARQQDDAKALITWFKNYRDFVLSGAWYPDSVFKDMSTSHIVKYKPDASGTSGSFRVMPPTLQMYRLGLTSDMYGKPYTLEKRHNICDRCEAFTESLIDSFKILTMENEGSPIVPSNNHIAMRFFILSHYIADCHMPLHCDARSFYNKNEVHGFIEDEWDKQVRSSYCIDEDNERFFYDPEGYPLKNIAMTELMKYVEEDLEKREFVWSWGTGCNNTWDYMSGISQYSYLMSYRLVPADHIPDEISKNLYMNSSAYKDHFLEYSKVILGDAVESIAKVWLHAWVRYRDWFRDTELAYFKAQQKQADNNLKTANKIIDNYPADKEKQAGKVKDSRSSLDAKQQDYDSTIAKGRNADKKAEALEKARTKLAEAEEKLARLEADYKEAQASLENLKALLLAAQIQVKRKEAEIKRYADSNSGI
ncbi:MAG: hypothetical protein J5490_03470 [Bacteroidales bacterium]|nr:hypothetical protein [Bacteroidales bacterium]